MVFDGGYGRKGLCERLTQVERHRRSVNTVQRAEKFERVADRDGTGIGGGRCGAENPVEQFDGADQVPGGLTNGVRETLVRAVLLVHDLGDEREGLARIAKVVDEPPGNLPVYGGAVESRDDLGRDGYGSRSANRGKLPPYRPTAIPP